MFDSIDAKRLKYLCSRENDQFVPSALFVGLTLLVTIAFWDRLTHAAARWTEGQYSHGWLIPLFAGLLMWMRYRPTYVVTASARWVGIGVIAVALLMRIALGYTALITADMYMFVPVMLGVVLVVGGWRGLIWAGPPVLFLIFMFPLPNRVQLKLLIPLQQIATVCSTYSLQTLGVDAFNSGNVINLENQPLGVIDQCAGLRMLTIFIALSVAMAMIVRATWWERAIIIVSSIPIALAANVIRITVTGLLYLVAGAETGAETGGESWFTHEMADFFFHTMAGWFMVPIALGLMLLEWKILNTLFYEPEETVVSMRLGPSRARAAVGK